MFVRSSNCLFNTDHVRYIEGRVNASVVGMIWSTAYLSNLSLEKWKQLLHEEYGDSILQTELIICDNEKMTILLNLRTVRVILSASPKLSNVYFMDGSMITVNMSLSELEDWHVHK